MRVCTHVCVYTYVHVYTRACVYTYVRVYTRACVYTYVRVGVHEYKHKSVYRACIVEDICISDFCVTHVTSLNWFGLLRGYRSGVGTINSMTCSL